MKVTVLRTDNTREEHTITGGPGAMKRISELIGAKTVDVNLIGKGLVMIVDDRGWECRTEESDVIIGPLGPGHQITLVPVRPLKPFNDQATAIYQRVRPRSDHRIVGDVAIAVDEDFA